MMTTHVLAVMADGDAPNPLIPHVAEIIIGVVVLLILVLLLKKFVIPNFEKAYAERTEAIEGGLKAAETKQAEADAKLAELEKQLADARHEAARIREEAREQGAQIVTEMREQATAESTRIVEHGKSQIEAERLAAVTSLRSEVGTLATSLAGRIVGESLDDDARQSRVVERFLADLESDAPAAAAPAAAPVAAAAPVETASADAAEFPGAVKAPADGSQPEGYLVKGNAESMLYHAPGGRWYDATAAEYWFKSEEDAIAAGFTKAGTRKKI